MNFIKDASQRGVLCADGKQTAVTLHYWSFSHLLVSNVLSFMGGMVVRLLRFCVLLGYRGAECG
jgi:hypothetical protein